METTYKLPIVLMPQPEGGYTVTCPLLPELVTEGDTVREALQNAGDALVAIGCVTVAAIGVTLTEQCMMVPRKLYRILFFRQKLQCVCLMLMLFRRVLN